MTVFHYHGRKTNADAVALLRRYLIGSGGTNAKFIFKYPNLCRQTYWDLKDLLKEIVTGKKTVLPEIGFSHQDKLLCVIRGAFRYLLFAPKFSQTWDNHFPASNQSQIGSVSAFDNPVRMREKLK
jgi:hypothetical protein